MFKDYGGTIAKTWKEPKYPHRWIDKEDMSTYIQGNTSHKKRMKQYNNMD